MDHTVTIRTRRRQLSDTRHDSCRFSCHCSGSINAHINTLSPTDFMFYHVTINDLKISSLVARLLSDLQGNKSFSIVFWNKQQAILPALTRLLIRQIATKKQSYI
jgi:hypothetical protein